MTCCSCCVQAATRVPACNNVPGCAPTRRTLSSRLSVCSCSPWSLRGLATFYNTLARLLDWTYSPNSYHTSYYDWCGISLPHQFSGVLKKFNSFQNDVMVDAGFNLDRLCENFGLGGGAATISPWSGAVHGRRLGEQIFSNIARARVHAERVIQRMKVFQVLKEPVPWEMVL